MTRPGHSTATRRTIVPISTATPLPPRAVKLGKRKASSEALVRPDKHIMTVSRAVAGQEHRPRRWSWPSAMLAVLVVLARWRGRLLARVSVGADAASQESKMHIDGPVVDHAKDGTIDESLYSRQL